MQIPKGRLRRGWSGECWICNERPALWQNIMIDSLTDISNEYNILLRLFTLPQSRTYKPNARGSDACRGSKSLWTRTLDRYTRAGLPECVISTMSGPPPKTKQDRTQRTHSPNPGTEIKIPDHAGNRTRAAGLKYRDSSDHIAETDSIHKKTINC